MKHTVLYLCMLATAVLFTACDSEDEDDGETFTITLTGAAEIPGPGDADGSGTAVVTLNEADEEVCFDIDVSGIEPVTMAHIHEAPAGESGDIVVDFQVATNGLDGCVTADESLIDDILADPAEFYVNVHNTPFPAGALRGQMD